jgi:DNA primase
MQRPGNTPTKNSNTRSDYSRYDIKQYLRDRNIRFESSGRNITTGWIGLNCPFCGDRSTHFGISNVGTFNCWVCGETGTIIKYIAEIEKCRYSTAESIFERYKTDEKQFLAQSEPVYTCEWPKGIQEKWPQVNLDYLLMRGFKPEEVIEKYHLRPTHIGGDYPYSIIAPVFINNEMVNYVVIDVHRGKYGRRSKYENCQNAKAVVPIKSCLYNIDLVNTPNMVIVEGIIDAWKVGDGAVATFGTAFTEVQLLHILKRKPKKIFIIYDAEPQALSSAREMACDLASICKKVEIIRLRNGTDPGDFSRDDTEQIRSLLYE